MSMYTHVFIFGSLFYTFSSSLVQKVGVISHMLIRFDLIRELRKRTCFLSKCQRGSNWNAFDCSTLSCNWTVRNDSNAGTCSIQDAHWRNKVNGARAGFLCSFPVSTFVVLVSHRHVRVRDMDSWMRVYTKYRTMQVYNAVFMAWLKFAIAPVLLAASCEIILLILITLRPSGLHPLIYMWFPPTAGIVMVVITLFCYECVIINRIGDEVLGKLRSKMLIGRLQISNEEKKRCLRIGKSLCGVYLAVGDFSEMTLNVPISMWEEVLNQLLFLLSL